MDLLGEFFEECCIINPLAKVTKKRLFEKYEQWAEASGEKLVSKRVFGRLMVERGFTEVRTGERGERHWQGIKLAGDTDITDITDTNSHIRYKQTSPIENRKTMSDVSDVSEGESKVTRLPL